jgi:hypothetical protein
MFQDRKPEIRYPTGEENDSLKPESQHLIGPERSIYVHWIRKGIINTVRNR